MIEKKGARVIKVKIVRRIKFLPRKKRRRKSCNKFNILLFLLSMINLNLFLLVSQRKSLSHKVIKSIVLLWQYFHFNYICWWIIKESDWRKFYWHFSIFREDLFWTFKEVFMVIVKYFWITFVTQEINFWWI